MIVLHFYVIQTYCQKRWYPEAFEVLVPRIDSDMRLIASAVN